MTKKLKKYLFLGLIMGMFIPSFAQAQGVFGGSAAQKIPTIQFERDNQYMADLLSLQNQVALLEKMIDRQQELNKMADNLAQLGMPFVPPAPEYKICEQLPANDVCAKSYPDLYEDYLMAAAMPEPLALPPAPSLPQIEDMAVIQSIDELDEDTAKSLEEAEFMWAEINCLNMVCKAIVVPKIQGNTSRYTTRIGDLLPNGLVVEKISTEGVVTSRGNTPILLEPAPSTLQQKQPLS